MNPVNQLRTKAQNRQSVQLDPVHGPTDQALGEPHDQCQQQHGEHHVDRTHHGGRASTAIAGHQTQRSSPPLSNSDGILRSKKVPNAPLQLLTVNNRITAKAISQISVTVMDILSSSIRSRVKG